MTRAQADALIARLHDAEKPVLIWGGFVSADPAADEAARALAKALGAKVLILGPMANSAGLERIGVLPSHDRYAYASMLHGDAKALFLSELDPARDPAVAKKLHGLDALIVHATVPTATTAIADVVLPGRTGYEKDGLTVNAEGRLLPVRAAPVEAGVATDLTGVVKYLGEVFGTRLDGRSVRSARRVLKKRLGVDPTELPDTGQLLPPPKRAPRGARALRAVDTGSGRALVVPSLVRIEHLERNPKLRAERGDAALRMHPSDAHAHGLTRGEIVTVPVGGVPRRLRVAPSEGVPEGVWLVPTLPEQPVGLYPLALDAITRERGETAEVA